VPGHPGNEEALQRGRRGIIRLQCRERRDVQASDRPPVEANRQIVGEGVDLGKLRHATSVPCPGNVM